MNDTSIEETLASFNRKERYWLIRNSLGAPPLCPDFRRRLGEALAPRLDHPISDRASWATDYHLDWLVAALHCHTVSSEADRFVPLENSDEMISATQEDIDLIVVDGRDLILVEAKAFGGWSSVQIRSKVNRLRALCDDRGFALRNAPPARQVRLHLVLMSRRRPRMLSCTEWPAWAVAPSGVPYWVELQIQGMPKVAKVSRCNANGDGDQRGACWTVQRRPASAVPRPADRRS